MFLATRFTTRFDRISTPRLVAIISFFGQLYFFVPVMTPYLLRMHLSMAEIAGMQTVLLWSQLLMEVPTGVFADRLGYCASYRVALVLATLGEILTLVACDYAVFLLAQVVAGTGFAFASGSVDALVYESLPADNRTERMQRARGLIGAAIHAASVVAYGTTALIVTNLSMERMRLTLILDVIGVGFAAFLSLGLQNPPRHELRPRLSSRLILRQGVTTLRQSRRLRRLVLISLVTNAFAAHLLVFYQAYFLAAGVSGRWFGWGLSLGSLVAIGCQWHAWRLGRCLGEQRGLIVATGIPGLLYLLMAMIHTTHGAVPLFVVQWGAIQLSAPIFAGLFNEQLAREARATTLSLINGIVSVYVGLIGLLFGWLAEHSLPWVFGLMGVTVLLGTLLILLGREPIWPVVSERSTMATTSRE